MHEQTDIPTGFKLFLDNQLPPEVQAEAEEFMCSLLNPPSFADYVAAIEAAGLSSDGIIDERGFGSWFARIEDEENNIRTRITVTISRRSASRLQVSVLAGTVLTDEPDDYSTLSMSWNEDSPRPSALAKVLTHATRYFSGP